MTSLSVAAVTVAVQHPPSVSRTWARCPTFQWRWTPTVHRTWVGDGVPVPPTTPCARCGWPPHWETVWTAAKATRNPPRSNRRGPTTSQTTPTTPRQPPPRHPTCQTTYTTRTPPPNTASAQRPSAWYLQIAPNPPPSPAIAVTTTRDSVVPSLGPVGNTRNTTGGIQSTTRPR